jgi:Heme NO binding.
MLDRFSRTYPEFFKDKSDPFSMLEAIESEVHVEVLKLYPDAELPRFETQRLDEDRLRMTYSSPRPLVKFCQGLIEACVEHFDRKAEIEVIHSTDNGRTTADFTVTLVA